MKLTFYSNACCTYESDSGQTLLTDPWLIDGVFEGSWYHLYPLRTKPHELAKADFVYLSHLHPDHCDERTLAFFPRETCFVLLDHGPNYLHRKMRAMGFENFILIKSGETKEVGDFRLTMFAPFAGNAFFESQLGNLLDSALLVEADGQKILNTNDNRPTNEAAIRLHSAFGPFDIVQLNYNAAGPYPSCFSNLSLEEKSSESKRLVNRNLEQMLQLAKIFSAKYVMPFAGAYLIGGSQSWKNNCLAGCTWDFAGRFLADHGCASEILLFHEGLCFDISAGSFVNGPYVPLSEEESSRRIVSVSQVPYWYEKVPEEKIPSLDYFRSALPKARENLWHFQERRDFFIDWNVFLDVQGEVFGFNLAGQEVSWNPVEKIEPYLYCRMHPVLLESVIEGKSHWNNLEIGCHIDFDRRPNKYLPDIHTMMSFFHRPRTSSK